MLHAHKSDLSTLHFESLAACACYSPALHVALKALQLLRQTKRSRSVSASVVVNALHSTRWRRATRQKDAVKLRHEQPTAR